MSLDVKDLIDNEQALRAGLKDVITYLRDSADKLQSGDVIDLDGLDEKVDAICLAAEKSSAPVAKKLESLMADMIAELEVLALHLKEEDLIMQNTDYDEEE